MPEIPRDPLPESTLALIRDPYRFISKRCERYRSDIVETTLTFQRTLCMRGREAAELFYSPQRLRRPAAGSHYRLPAAPGLAAKSIHPLQRQGNGMTHDCPNRQLARPSRNLPWVIVNETSQRFSWAQLLALALCVGCWH